MEEDLGEWEDKDQQTQTYQIKFFLELLEYTVPILEV